MKFLSIVVAATMAALASAGCSGRKCLFLDIYALGTC